MSDRWCIVYVDTADQSAVVAVLAPLLGPPDALDVFRVPGFTVDVRRNPDHTGGEHYLDWPTTIEIDAADDTAVDTAEQSLTAFVAGITARLRDATLPTATEESPPPHTD